MTPLHPTLGHTLGHTLRHTLGRASIAAALVLSGPLAAAQSELYSVGGPAPFAALGRSLDAAGDVNGDGSPDWIAGSSSGARVHSGLDGALLHDFPAPPGNSLFGWNVAGAGDTNLDGFADLLVGAQLDDSSHPNAGRAWLLSGADGSVIRWHDGGAPQAFMGSALAGLSDVDGDGHSDYAASAPGEGVVRVFSGRTGGLVVAFSGPGLGSSDDIDAAGDVDGDGVDDLVVGIIEGSGSVRVYSTVTGLCVREVTGAGLGIPTGAWFGARVAGLGDLDGDGHAEFAASAYLEGAHGLSGVGRVRIFSGATGRVLRAHAGPRAGLRFGLSLASAGDVDADGVPDLIVGAPSVQGSIAGSLINQEPTIAQVFSGATGRLLYTYGGEFSIDLFGTSVAGIGDVDGDGLGDVAVGATLDDEAGNSSGRVHVFGGAGCPQSRRYCTSLPHSNFGQRARIGSLGSVTFAGDDLVLYAVDAGPQRVGTFLHGSSPTFVPAGDGILCIGGQTGSLAVVPTNFAGIAILELAPLASSAFAPGQTVFFQYVFRDAGSTGAGFNGSDAISVTFCH